MNLIPTVIQKSHKGERAYDIYSFLLQNRIVFLSGRIEEQIASSIVAQMLFLEAEDPHKDIHVYINSPGGAVYDALAIYDTMQLVQPDIQTWGLGVAASCGSFLLAAGTPGKRNALPNARVMLHEPSGGFQGRSLHFEDHANEIMFIRKKLIEIYKHHTKAQEEQIEKWINRETFFSAQEAKDLGLIDNIKNKHTEA